MQKLTIDHDHLKMVWQTNPDEMGSEAYLDTQTGNVIFFEISLRGQLDKVPGDFDTLEELLTALDSAQGLQDLNKQQLQEIARIDFDDEGRYISIPADTSREGYQDMEEFIQTVSDKYVRELLFVAIDGPGAFGRFKGVIHSHQEVKEQWYKFRDARLDQRIRGWLKDHDIKAEFV